MLQTIEGGAEMRRPFAFWLVKNPFASTIKPMHFSWLWIQTTLNGL
jgi:hypothetical protein